MRFLQFFTIFYLFCSNFIFSQRNIKHTVVQGESIYSIAKKYEVKENDIYELNPKVKGTLLQLKTILLIPNKKKNTKEKNSKNEGLVEFHIVESGESLYKIAKKYEITLEKLKEFNPDINPETIQIGDKILISEKREILNRKAEVLNEKENSFFSNIDANLCLDELGNQIHTVVKGETLYKLAKKYKVSIKDLEEMNPEIVTNLPIGYEVVVKKGNVELVKHQNEISNIPKEIVSLSSENMSKAEFLIAKASQCLGTRYRGGGTTSAGFDCSGLMFSTFKSIDMILPRSSSSMAMGAGFKINRSQAQKGDLIFFTTNGKGRINHVGMITEINGDEIKFIHSTIQAGVIISSTEEPYYKKRFIQINRVLQE